MYVQFLVFMAASQFFFLQKIEASGTGSDNGYRYRVIGLFSACQQQESGPHFHQSMLPTKASMYKTLSEVLLTRDYETTNTCANFTQTVMFESHDVCRNLTRLTEILVNISLNANYYSHTDDGDAVDEFKSSTVVLFLTYLSQDLQIALASFIYIDSTKDRKAAGMMALNEEIVLPQAFQVSGNILVSHTSDMINILIHRFKWRRIGMIFLERSGDTSNEIYKEQYQSNLNQINNLPICFFTETVDVDHSEQYGTVVEKIKLESVDVPIIVFGHRNFLRRFIEMVDKDQKYGSVKRVWVGFDIVTRDMDLNSIKYRIISIERTQHLRMRKFISNNRNFFPPPPPLHNLWEADNTNSTYNKVLLAVYVVKDATCRVAKLEYSLARTRLQCFSILKNIYKSDLVLTKPTPEYRVVSILVTNLESDEALQSYIKYYQQQINCSSIVCGIGYYRTFGKQSAFETSAWNYSVGWTCRKCPTNHFKNSEGDAPCERCPRYHSSSYQRTFCFGLYQETFLNTNMFVVQLTIAVSSALVLITLVAASIFINHRHTPLVQAMDFNLSIFHLLSIAVPLSLNFLVFQGKPNLYRCISRPLSIAVFNTTTISIVLVKSQKLLQAFHSKVRLRHRQVLLTSLKQAAIVVVNILSAIMLLMATLNFKPLEIESVRHDDDLQLKIFCGGGMDLHISVQVIYQILLQITCFVPAFRGRNLPNVFNEAMTIIYASFLMNVAFLVLFPIQYFQKEMRYRAMVQWTVLNCNAFSVLFLLYGKKLYLVVFKPEKNTRAYFREQTMHSLTKKARKLTTR